MEDQRAFASLRNELALVRAGASRQRSAIWALVYKEYKIKLGNSRIGIIWTLLEPIVGMLMISGIWYFSGRVEIHGVHVTLFIGSGFIIFVAVRQGLSYIPYAIDANVALLNYPQVKPLDTVLARFVQAMWLHALASILMLVGVWWVLDISPKFDDPLLCVVSLFVSMLLCLGAAVPLAVIGTLNENILKFVAIISQPLMFVSAVMYSMNELPTVAQAILQWNPIIHVVEAFRVGAFGIKPFAYYNLYYPFACGMIGLGFGYALYYRYRFKLLSK